MSIPRPVVVKVLTSLTLVWNVRLANAYPIRAALAAQGFHYHPGRKTWEKQVRCEASAEVLMQVLQLITQARLNLSADSSPLVAELLHDSAAYFDNPSQSWVWQTPPEFLLELPSPEEWLPHAYASLVEHPFEWLQEQTVSKELTCELFRNPEVFEDVVFRLSLAQVLQAPAELTQGMASDAGLVYLFGMYRRRYGQGQGSAMLTPRRMRDTADQLEQEVTQEAERPWIALALVYRKLRALGLMEEGEDTAAERTYRTLEAWAKGEDIA